MPLYTGQQIVNDALTYLALMDPGGSPSASDSNTCLQVLNNMWEAWGIDEGLIYAILATQYPLTAYQQSYSIGPTSADWTAANYPQRIYSASAVDAVSFTATTTATSKTIAATSTAGLYIGMRVMGVGIPFNSTILSIVANTSIGITYAATASGSVTLVATGLNRNPLKIVESAEYLAHNDLGASATTPDEIYPKYLPDENGNIRVYVFPVVNENQLSYIELEAAVPFAQWALAVQYSIPVAYRDALGWALAFRCLPIFGEAVGQGAAQVVGSEGEKAENRLRTMNQKNRQIPESAAAAPGTPEQAPQRAA